MIFVIKTVLLFLFGFKAFGFESFHDGTKIHWIVKIMKDGQEKSYQQKEIQSMISEGIGHPKLSLRCRLQLEREHITFDPSGKNGYTRDEERVETFCEQGDQEIQLKRVKCAHGYGKKGIGSIYGDSNRFLLKKGKDSFEIRVRCSHK
ncbi:MAG: hypothetical protein AAF203_04770 [Pseudomonadota bacterium]